MKRLSVITLLCILMINNIESGRAKSVRGVMPGVSVRTDTTLIKSKKAAVFIIPTDEEIDRLKLRYNSEENFYTMADEGARYLIQAKTYLEKNGIEIVVADTTCRVVNFADSFYMDLSDTTIIGNPLFDIILYRDGFRPLITSSVEVNSDAPDYLGLSIFDVTSVNQGTSRP